MNKPTVHVIYCDDIRNEEGRKISLMGIYDSELVVQSFPLTLPKLCAQILIKFPGQALPKDLLKIELLSGESPIAVFELDQKALHAVVIPDADDQVLEEERHVSIQVHFMLAPFNLEKPSILRVHCQADKKLIKGNALRLRIATPQEVIALGLNPAPQPEAN